jgi:hypothetical protein
MKIILGTSSKNKRWDIQKSIHWCIHVKLGQKPALTFGSRSRKVMFKFEQLSILGFGASDRPMLRVWGTTVP